MADKNPKKQDPDAQELGAQELKTQSPLQAPNAGGDQPEYVPSSPTRRIVAWVGLAYMVILVLLNYYALSTGGFVRGVGTLMLCPAVAGLGILTVSNYRAGKGRGGLPAAIFISGLCAVVFVFGLVLGIPALSQQLGGAG